MTHRQPSNAGLPALVALISVLVSPALPALEAAVDVNGDALVVPGPVPGYAVPVDRTSATTPFLFWLNDDQDDLELYESWPHEQPDNTDGQPGSLRDLEDLTRLMVTRQSWADGDAVTLRLRWRDPVKAPTIRVWRAQDRGCSRSYLEETAVGQAQLSPPYNSALGVVGADGLDIPMGQWETLEFDTQTRCLLFEGVLAGRGALELALLKDGVEVERAAPIHMEIRPIKTFYERVGVAWPSDVVVPWLYSKPPPIPELTWSPEPMGHRFVQPWYETDDTIVWVHGWIPQDDENYRRTLVFSFETMWKRLWHQGFRGRVVHFRWPTVKKIQMIGLRVSEYRAYKAAPALVDYVHGLPEHRRVHVTCHSLGGVILLEALKLGLTAEHALFQVSAVPAESFDPDESLVLDEMADLDIPRDAAQMGYAGYLKESKTPIYSAYNPADFTWFGWNAAQKFGKQSAGVGRSYVYKPREDTVSPFELEYWGSLQRFVTDHHETMAHAVPARSQALGGEGRVGGMVRESFNLHEPPYAFGSDHVAMWRWNPQKVLPYSNLILDVFDIPFNSAGLAGSNQ